MVTSSSGLTGFNHRAFGNRNSVTPSAKNIAAMADTTEATMRYAAGAILLPVARIKATATMGALPPKIPIPTFNTNPCPLTR